MFFSFGGLTDLCLQKNLLFPQGPARASIPWILCWQSAIQLAFSVEMFTPPFKWSGETRQSAWGQTQTTLLKLVVGRAQVCRCPDKLLIPVHYKYSTWFRGLKWLLFENSLLEGTHHEGLAFRRQILEISPGSGRDVSLRKPLLPGWAINELFRGVSLIKVSTF